MIFTTTSSAIAESPHKSHFFSSNLPGSSNFFGICAESTAGGSAGTKNALKPIIPQGMTMAQMPLRFILSNPSVGTIIPGMRRIKNVEVNLGTSDGKGLSQELVGELRKHRWDRTPTEWSQ